MNLLVLSAGLFSFQLHQQILSADVLPRLDMHRLHRGVAFGAN